jgi:hypothetical protein
MDDSSPDSCSLGVRAMYGLLEYHRTGYCSSEELSVIEQRQLAVILSLSVSCD